MIIIIIKEKANANVGWAVGGNLCRHHSVFTGQMQCELGHVLSARRRAHARWACAGRPLAGMGLARQMLCGALGAASEREQRVRPQSASTSWPLSCPSALRQMEPAAARWAPVFNCANSIAKTRAASFLLPQTANQFARVRHTGVPLPLSSGFIPFPPQEPFSRNVAQMGRVVSSPRAGSAWKLAMVARDKSKPRSSQPPPPSDAPQYVRIFSRAALVRHPDSQLSSSISRNHHAEPTL